MTGNLGKFSTEPAADGRRVRTKRESSKRGKGKGGEGGETCADYLTRLELALRVWQQMAFLDSNQRSVVGRQQEGVWGVRGGCNMTVDELCIHPQQAKYIKGTFNSTFLFWLKL